jgi:hypothetical protein
MESLNVFNTFVLYSQRHDVYMPARLPKKTPNKWSAWDPADEDPDKEPIPRTFPSLKAADDARYHWMRADSSRQLNDLIVLKAELNILR